MSSLPVTPRWKLLCEAAKDEQDPEKLLQLILAINHELERKEQQDGAASLDDRH